MRLTGIHISNHGTICNCDLPIVTTSGVILFYGDCGSGKTTVANAIAEELTGNPINSKDIFPSVINDDSFNNARRSAEKGELPSVTGKINTSDLVGQYIQLIDRMALNFGNHRWRDRYSISDFIAKKACLSHSQHIECYLAYVFACRDYLYEKYEITPAPVVIDELLDQCTHDEVVRIIEFLSGRPEQIFVFLSSRFKFMSKYEAFEITQVNDMESKISVLDI